MFDTRVQRRRSPTPVRDASHNQLTTSSGTGVLFAGVNWTPAYIAFLVYVFVITTYRLPLGTAAMVVALVMLPLERTRLRMPPPVGWAMCFLVWAIVGWGSSHYPTIVWDSVIEFAKICGVLLVAVNVLTSRARLQLFFLAFLAFFACYPARGALFAYFLYDGTVQGRAAWNYAYNNPNDLAALCLLPLSLSAGMLVVAEQRWIRYAAAAGVILLPFVILLTQSRGAFIALLAFTLPILRTQKRRGTLLALAAALGVVIAVAAPDSVWRRLATLTDVTSAQAAANAADEGSARQRIEIWRVARTIVLENPLTGVGLGAYPEAHFTYAQRPTFDPTALGHRDAHSTYLHVLAQTGVIGLVLFVLIVATTIREAEQARRRAKPILPRRALQLFYLELGLFAYLIAGIWGSYDLLVLTYLYLAIMYSAAHVLKLEIAPATTVASAKRKVRGGPVMNLGTRAAH